MAKLRVVASIEARMGSSRLPGKVLMDINGKPALRRLVDRLGMCRSLDGIVVATSISAGDDVLARWCAENGVACYRGSEDDVLKRVVEAQKFMGADLVVEITGDCPLTDPEIVDLGVGTFLAHDVDIVSNCGRALTWPMGQYVQVFPLALLDEVDRTINDPAVHEHVSLYFYEHPARYRLLDLIAPRRWQEPAWRMQLDYPADLLFLNEVYRHLEPLHGEGFGIEEVVSLLHREPKLVQINIHCEEKATR
jgi:spore coat polysaccharide biosynthesis protein SpsF